MHRRIPMAPFRRYFFLLLTLPLLFSGLLTAGGHDGHDHPQVPPKSSQVKFIQNQNQFEEVIRYKADIPGGFLFLENASLTYSFWDTENLHDRFFHTDRDRGDLGLRIDCHAVKVGFAGANSTPAISEQNKAKEYYNYFIGDKSRWAGGVPLFGGVRYHELYDGIDMQFWGMEGTVKYEFYVTPEADPAVIQMEYAGPDELYVQNGELHIVTSVNHVVEAQPFAYQEIEGQKVPIPCNFVVNGSKVSFDFPQGYDRTRDLVIDPTLIFSTYTGSFADNFGYTATYDTSGALYGGGIAFGVVGNYPTTAGAFQTTFGGGGTGAPWALSGGIDISLTKFDPTGATMVWSSYLGGADNEQPHSLITNEAGALFMLGTSYSADYPTSTTAYDTILGGAADIVVSHISPSGSTLVASTFVGGAQSDGLNSSTGFLRTGLKYNYGDESRGEIMLDDNGDVYVASCSWGTDFPTTAGVVQGTSGGGFQDGVVFKMPPNLSTLTWSTFLGGSNFDAAYNLKVGSGGEVYVTGGTNSNNYPTTTGAISTSLVGGIDGWVTVLNPNATAITASTYLGTTSYDQSYFLQLDQDGDVYVFGQTLGAWPVSTGVYSETNGKHFIQKMDPALTNVIFSTIFGSGGSDINISPTAFLVDVCEYIYCAGWGGTVNFGGTNTNNMTVTLDAEKDTTDGSDVYIFILERDAIALEYATYFGGDTAAEHVDGGTSRFNKDLEIYHAVCAGCGGRDDFPYTPGAWSATNNAANNNCNLGVFKMAFTPQNVAANFTASVQSWCAPFPATFQNTSTGGVRYIWNYGDSTLNDTTFSAVSVTHQYDSAGVYTIILIAEDSNSCNVADTHVTTLTVYEIPLASVSGGNVSCASGPVQLTASGGDHYQWSPSTWLSNDTVANPTANPPVTTTYTVIVTNNGGCADTAQVTVTVSNFQVDAGPPGDFCAGSNGALLQAQPLGGTAPYYYQWWCDTTGGNNCGIDSTFDDDPRVLPTNSSWYYVQVTDANGCVSEPDSVFVTVLPLPIVDAGPDLYACPLPSQGVQINPTISGAPGPYTYQWSPSTGLSNPTILNPYARPDTTTIYTLVVGSSNGCTSDPTTLDTLSTVTVNVYPQPVAEAGPDLDLCFGDTLRLQGFGTNAGPNYRFEWSPFNTLDDGTLQNPLAWPSLTTEYILVTYSNGCPSYGDTVRVNVHTLPTVSAGNTVDICLGESDVLDGDAWGDSTSTFYSYQWTPSAYLDNDTLEDPTASPPNDTWYYVQATSSYGCESPIDSVLVQVLPTPIAEAGPSQIICGDTAITLQGGYYYTTTDSVNDTTQIVYYWSPQSGLSDPTLARPQAQPATSRWYYLDVFHLTCNTRDSVLVDVIPNLGATATADTNLICSGDSIQLTGNGGTGAATFRWEPPISVGNPNAGTTLAAPDSTVNFLFIASQSGCHDTVVVPIEVIPTPEAAYLSSQLEGCVDFTVNFLETASNGILYAWDFGDGTPIVNGANPTHTFTAPGDYPVTLTAIGPGGCSGSATDVVVTVYDTAGAGFRSEPAFPVELTFPGTTVSFFEESVGAVEYLWDFGDGNTSLDPNPTHTYTTAGEFFVTLTVFNDEGCPSRVVHGPFVIRAPEIFIPNVFTPNGDGNNDGFLVEYSGDQPFLLTIYDRWNIKVFESKNKYEPWDGMTLSQTKAQAGVFFYTLMIGDKEYAGTVSLVR